MSGPVSGPLWALWAPGILPPLTPPPSRRACSSQIIISNILIHKCLIASPNLCQIVAPNGSLGSFCAKLLRQINICYQSAPKMCAKFCSSRCSAPKIFRKYTLKFTLGFCRILNKIIEITCNRIYNDVMWLLKYFLIKSGLANQNFIYWKKASD